LIEIVPFLNTLEILKMLFIKYARANRNKPWLETNPCHLYLAGISSFCSMSSE
jgi:hypothetical protein